jgi:hypothetical protein
MNPHRRMIFCAAVESGPASSDKISSVNEA